MKPPLVFLLLAAICLVVLACALITDKGAVEDDGHAWPEN